MVTDDDLREGRVYPPLKSVRDVSTRLATRIVEYCYEAGRASTYPEPRDKEAYVREHQYSPQYESFLPVTYPWPGMCE